MSHSVEVAGAAKHRKKMERIRKGIAKIGLACSGTLYVRKKACGKPNCRCAKNPDQLHGPYYE